jgi:hypothetical protein
MPICRYQRKQKFMVDLIADSLCNDCITSAITEGEKTKSKAIDLCYAAAHAFRMIVPPAMLPSMQTKTIQYQTLI